MSRRHRHSYTRRLLRANLKAFLHDNVLGLVGIVLLATVAPILAMFLTTRFNQGVLVGMMVIAVPYTVLFGFLIHTGGLDQIVGALGEDRTRDELSKAVRCSHVWGWVDNIELDRMDIDHLVIATGVILAIETKWHMRDATDRTLEWDAFQAHQSADKARSILRSKGVGYAHEVVPLVVVWGRGRLDVPDGGVVVDGVRVVRGDELGSRLAGLPTGDIIQDVAESLLTRLEVFAAEHRVVTPAHRGTLALLSRLLTPASARWRASRRRLA